MAMPNRSEKTILVGILWLFLASCGFLSTQYVGKLYLYNSTGDKIKSLSSSNFSFVEGTIFGIASKYGFVSINVVLEDGIALIKKRKVRPAEYANVSGSDAYMTIAASNRAPLQITIRDFDNDDETDFTRMIKNDLFSNLENRYGIGRIKFVESEPSLLDD